MAFLMISLSKKVGHKDVFYLVQATVIQEGLPSQTSTKHKRHKKKFPIGMLPYLILLIALIVSWYYELQTGESWFHNVRPESECPFFMRASVVMETIKVLGFSTILIGVIYSSLDKKILGLTYSELLQYKFVAYHPCSVAHIISTILCIITSTAGTSESAVITLVAVLYGFLYQWIVVYRIVLNSFSCEKIAVSKWKDSFEACNRSFDAVMRLAGTLPLPESKHYKAHLNCLGMALLKHTDHLSPSILLQQLVDVWTVIQKMTESRDQRLVTMDLFEELLQIKKQSTNVQRNNQKALNTIACGYLVQQIVAYTNQDNDSKTEYDIFIDLSNRLASLSRTLLCNTLIVDKEAAKTTVNCMFTNYCVLVLVQFQYGMLQLSSEMLELKPSELVDDCVEEVVNYFIIPANNKQMKTTKAFIKKGLAFLR